MREGAERPELTGEHRSCVTERVEVIGIQIKHLTTNSGNFREGR